MLGKVNEKASSQPERHKRRSEIRLVRSIAHLTAYTKPTSDCIVAIMLDDIGIVPLDLVHNHIFHLHNILFSIVVIVVDNAHLSLSVLGLCEKTVDVFECQALGLGEEEPDDRDPCRVECLLFNVSKMIARRG